MGKGPLSYLSWYTYRSFDVQVRGGYSYFITFIDDLSRYGYMYLMKHKFEAFERFKKLITKVKK